MRFIKYNIIVTLLLYTSMAIIISSCEHPTESEKIKPPKTLWTKTFRGGVGHSIQQTSDGGYIITGASSNNVWLFKTDASGDKLWTKTLDIGDHGEEGVSVQQVTDKGYIITGYTCCPFSFSTPQWYSDLLLIKTDPTGDSLWTRIFGSFAHDGGFSVQQTSDGGYIVTGWNGFDISRKVWLIKTDSSGDTLWTKTFGGGEFDHGHSVQQTSDGGYIVAGWTDTPGSGLDALLIKTDASGNELWTKTFGENGGGYGYSVQQTFDGGYIIIGTSRGDVWLIKTGSSGNTHWTKTFGGSGMDYGRSIQQTTDEGYIILGSTESYGAGEHDLWLIRTDASGDTLWTKTYGGEYNDRGISIQKTADEGYIILGSTFSYSENESWDNWLIKLAPE